MIDFSLPRIGEYESGLNDVDKALNDTYQNVKFHADKLKGKLDDLLHANDGYFKKAQDDYRFASETLSHNRYVLDKLKSQLACAKENMQSIKSELARSAPMPPAENAPDEKWAKYKSDYSAYKKNQDELKKEKEEAQREIYSIESHIAEVKDTLSRLENIKEEIQKKTDELKEYYRELINAKDAVWNATEDFRRKRNDTQSMIGIVRSSINRIRNLITNNLVPEIEQLTDRRIDAYNANYTDPLDGQTFLRTADALKASIASIDTDISCLFFDISRYRSSIQDKVSELAEREADDIRIHLSEMNKILSEKCDRMYNAGIALSQYIDAKVY